MAISVEDAVFIVFVGLLLLFAVTSNFLVIYVVWKNKKMRNVTNILICNLSCSDIILAGIILPQNLHDLSHEEEFHEGRFLCKIAFAFPILCITTASYTLACIAFERKHCIVDSLKTQITINHCKFIVPCIWLVAIVAATPTIVEFNVVAQTVTEGNDTRTSLACNSQNVPHAFVIGNGIMLIVVTYLIPLVIILYNYAKIIYFVINQTKSSTDQSSASAVAQTTILKKRMKIIKMLIIVAALFAISWLPYFITLLIGKMTNTDGSENASDGVFLTKIFLAAFSTSYNVILYVMFNPMFKQAFQNIFRCFTRKNKVESFSPKGKEVNLDTPHQGTTASSLE